MKNSSKNFSGKNDEKRKKNANSYSNNTNSSKKNTRYLINSKKNDRFDIQSESNKKNFSSFKNRNLRNKPNIELTNKAQESYQESSYKKNFDDWIWGKHSVFEAFVNERAINRIWCTSDIFSSEKFYILLKDLKSKGVLVEEVSWNRLSQLTCGASHQGVALQLACAKTISLEDLIDFSKK